MGGQYQENVNIEVITRIYMSFVAKNDEETIDLAHDYFDRSTFYDDII